MADLTGDGIPEIFISHVGMRQVGTVFLLVNGEWLPSFARDGLQLADGRLVGTDRYCVPDCATGGTVNYEYFWNGTDFVPIETIAVTPNQPPASGGPCPTYTEQAGAPFSLCTSGRGVQYLQQALIYFEYLNGTADGFYGPNTEAAVKALQRDYGVPEDGIATGWWYQEFIETYNCYRGLCS